MATTLKPSSAQIAARERFAAMARAGKFKRAGAKSATRKRAADPAAGRKRNGIVLSEPEEYFGQLVSSGAWVKSPRPKKTAMGRTYAYTKDFAEASPMSESEAAAFKTHCDENRMRCKLLPVMMPNPRKRGAPVKRNPSASGRGMRARVVQPNPAPRRKVTHVELDSTGDHFGADQTTVQLWHLRSAETKRAYRSFRIPADIIRNADFQAWARGMNYVLSCNYRQMLDKIRRFT